MIYNIKILAPAKAFLQSLDVKLRAKAFRTISLLQEFGPFLTEPHSKKIKQYEKLFELRVRHGSNICRLFYFYFRNNIYIVTSGYLKKDQKLNKSELIKAKNIMNRYLEKYNG
jgi:phage-related protein